MEKIVSKAMLRAVAALTLGTVLGVSFGNAGAVVAEAGNTATYEVLRTANVRTSPSSEGEILAVAQEGSLVSCITEDVNGYALIAFDGVEGYIFGGCLSLKEEEAAPQKKAGTEQKSQKATTLKTLAGLSLRESPSSEADVLAVVPAGKRVEILDEGENGYYHVFYKGKEGYVYAKALDEERKIDLGLNINTTKRSTSQVTDTIIEETVEEEMPVKMEHTTSPDVVVEAEMQVATTVTEMPTIPSGRTLNGTYPTPVEFLGITPAVFNCTAYCTCRVCCGPYSPEVTGREPHTATGTVPQQGRTIAVDPRVIPYGTHVYIEGYGEFIAEDTGGAIRGNRIDVYFATHQDAIIFGRRTLNVWILP